MDRYDNFDQAIVARRVSPFRDRTRRFLAGEPTEEDSRPLCVRKGLYVQKHASMLRVAIPYALLPTVQLFKLAVRGEVGVLVGLANDPAALSRQAAASAD